VRPYQSRLRIVTGNLEADSDGASTRTRIIGTAAFLQVAARAGPRASASRRGCWPGSVTGRRMAEHEDKTSTAVPPAALLGPCATCRPFTRVRGIWEFALFDLFKHGPVPAGSCHALWGDWSVRAIQVSHRRRTSSRRANDRRTGHARPAATTCSRTRRPGRRRRSWDSDGTYHLVWPALMADIGGTRNVTRSEMPFPQRAPPVRESVRVGGGYCRGRPGIKEETARAVHPRRKDRLLCLSMSLHSGRMGWDL
jgi:hypothetical protein